MCQDEVMMEAEALSGRVPGSPAFLGSLQDATTTLWERLSPADQRIYANLANRWSNDAPPPNIQARYLYLSHLHWSNTGINRMATSMSGKIIHDFQTQLYKTCGVWCIVLTAHKHENGRIITGM